MDYKIVLLLVNTAFNFILGILVWLSGARNELRKVFIVFSGAIGMWSFGLAIFFLSRDSLIALFWAKTLYIAGSTIALSLCYFSFIFPTFYLDRKFLPWAKSFLFGFSGIVFFLTLFTNYVLSGVLEGNYKGLIYDWGYVLWLLHFLSLMTVAFINQFIQLKRSSGIEKLQVKYMLIGTFTAAIFGSATNVIMPTFGYFRFFGLGPLLTISMAGFIAYAIIKHRLMDIRLVIARTVAYSILVLVIGVFYVSASFLLSAILLGSNLAGNQLIIYSILTLIVAFSFERLRNGVEKVTDKFFFKGRYNSGQLLSKLGNIMSANIELESLSAQILQTLTSEMRISRGTLVFLEKDTIYKASAVGYNFPHNYSYTQLAPLLFQQILIFDELPEGELKQLMRTLNISVSVCLQIKEEKVGLLLLGEKSSGETYSGEDLKVLEILAPEVVITIENAKSYDKIKKFNVTLSDEVRRATGELQEANERLKQLDQLKDDFVSIASHELRTPMAAIRSYAWMALHRSDVPISEKVEKYLVRILMSTERLINLVNDMLNISRIESGRVDINPELVDLISLCKDIVDEVYYSKSTAKNVKFVLLEEKLPKVFADPEKLRQVVLNILGNALKFSPIGGKINIGFFTDGITVETYIKDEGPGMAREDLSKLFKKFGRLDSTYTAAAVSGGTGLGLYISKNLMELMKGRIWAASEGLGKGSTFSFALPVATGEVLKHAEEYTVKARGEAKGLEPAAV